MKPEKIILAVAILGAFSPAQALRMPRSFGEILAATDVVVTGTITKVERGRGGQFDFTIAETVYGEAPTSDSLTLKSGYYGCYASQSYVPGTAMLLLLDDVTTGPAAGTIQLSMEESAASMRIPTPQNPPPYQYDTLKDLDIPLAELRDALARRAEIRAVTIETIAASQPASREAVWKLQSNPGEKLQAITARSKAHKAIVDAVIMEIANSYWYRDDQRELPKGEGALAPDIIKAFIEPVRDLRENP